MAKPEEVGSTPASSRRRRDAVQALVDKGDGRCHPRRGPPCKVVLFDALGEMEAGGGKP